METRWQIEVDPTCRYILQKHWPQVKRYGDLKEVDPSQLEQVDVIAAGYPCQPFSTAGRRLGEEDGRHLWPQLWRLIRKVGPRFVFLENVPHHLVLGFGTVLGDLANGGFDAEWDLLSAAQFGAPHLRRRLWIVAFPAGEGLEIRPHETDLWQRSTPVGAGDDAHTYHRRQQEHRAADDQQGQHQSRWGDTGGCGADVRRGHHPGAASDTQRSPVRDWREWDREQHPHQGKAQPGNLGPVRREDGWHWQGPAGTPWEIESPPFVVAHGLPGWVVRSDGVNLMTRRKVLHAIGNALVPGIAEWIGRRIIRAAERSES